VQIENGETLRVRDVGFKEYVVEREGGRVATMKRDARGIDRLINIGVDEDEVLWLAVAVAIDQWDGDYSLL
jgi:hypothetical protein